MKERCNFEVYFIITLPWNSTGTHAHLHACTRAHMHTHTHTHNQSHLNIGYFNKEINVVLERRK